MSDKLDAFMNKLYKTHPNEPEFHQAVYEVVKSVLPVVERTPKYQEAKILERLVEPERIIIFRVTWVDDNGNIQVNRGFRIQMNSAIGPYKGGLRFHPTVNLSILKFLAFEQQLKNSLTTLPMGGSKGGSDFDPKGKSNAEVMRFCQAFANELWRHIGQFIDVPAGDIGVGAREIGYLFGQIKRLKNTFTGIFTGKKFNWGGSRVRPEATGYGQVYFAEEMLKTRAETIKGKICAISGSGNVAQGATEKAIQLGAKVITLSDSNGCIYDKDGINVEKLEWVKDLKNVRRGRIREYAEKFGCEYYEGKRPWGIPCDVALPSATQNEIDVDNAKELIKNGCVCVSEGANMPSTLKAIDVFLENKILFGPGKAANAGGVAVSGLEMSQNSLRLQWSREEVDGKLHQIMKDIHEQCVTHGASHDGTFVNYVDGANIAGFVKLADSMIDQGVIF